MQTFLVRYQLGEYEQVWNELIALGEQVREPPLVDDAVAVAREFARRAWINSQIIYDRLIGLGYEFADPTGALVPAGPATASWIERIERELGILPLSVRAWYEVFASLNFAQAWDQLKPPGTSEMSGLGMNICLVMVNPRKARGLWHSYRRSYREERRKSAAFPGEFPDLPPKPDPFLPTGTFASNNDPKGFHLPDRNADAVFYNEGFGDTFFVAEMRRCFAFGGFPIWKRLARKKRWGAFARPNVERIIPLLMKDLLAL